MTVEVASLIFTFLGWFIAAFFAGRNWFPIEREYDEIRFMLAEILKAVGRGDLIEEEEEEEESE